MVLVLAPAEPPSTSDARLPVPAVEASIADWRPARWPIRAAEKVILGDVICLKIAFAGRWPRGHGQHRSAWRRRFE